MNRKDFYVNQLVTQADLDSAFDYCEAADQDLQADNGYVGIANGLTLVENNPTPDLTCDISAGTAYDQVGQRINVAATQNLNLAIDSNSVSTAVASGGNEKWVSVFIAFDRVLSDPRTDGNGVPLQYERSESFQFIVDQGAEAAAGTAAVYTSTNTETFALANGQTLELVVDNTPSVTVTFLTGDFAAIGAATAAEVAAVIQAQHPGTTAIGSGGAVVISSRMTGPSASVRVVGGTAFSVFGWPASAAVGSGGPARPALRSDALLLADVLLRNGTTQIVDAPDPGGGVGVIDAFSRRQFVFVYTGSQFSIKEGTITEFGTALAQEVTNHIAEVGTSHPASAILYDPTVLPIPAAMSGLAASSEVQSAVDGFASDILSTSATRGADLVGFNNTLTVTPLPNSPTTVLDAIRAIVDGLGGGAVTLDASSYTFSNDIAVTGDITAATSITAGTVTTSTALVSNGSGTFTGSNVFSGFSNHFSGDFLRKSDTAHALAWDLFIRESSIQDTGSITDTVDIVLLSDVNAVAGIIRGSAMCYTDNTNDSFIGVEFIIPFTKLAASTPVISAANPFIEIGGAGAITVSGAAPTSATLSIVTSSNTISLRMTHNSGPTTRNLVTSWQVLSGPLNS